MKAIAAMEYGSPDGLPLKEAQKSTPKDDGIAEAFAELERGVHAALETYSNVHRGSGHNSMVSTYLFEQARDVVLEYLGLNGGLLHTDKYAVIENSAEDVDTLVRVLGQIARQPRAGVDNPFASTQTVVQQQMEDFARAAAQRVYTQV